MVLVDAPVGEVFRINATPVGANLVLHPALPLRLVAVLQDILGSRAQAGVLASSEVRRHLCSLLDRLGSEIAVRTQGERLPDFKLEVLGALQHAQIVPASTGGVRGPPHLALVGESA